MSTQPAYAATPILPVVAISTANTARDGTGTIATIAVGRTPGTRLERIMVQAAGTTTAGFVRIFKKDSGLTLNADGTVASYSSPTWRLVKEIAIAAATPSATVAASTGEWAPDGGISIGPFESLGASTHNAESFIVAPVGAHL